MFFPLAADPLVFPWANSCPDRVCDPRPDPGPFSWRMPVLIPGWKPGRIP